MSENSPLPRKAQLDKAEREQLEDVVTEMRDRAEANVRHQLEEYDFEERPSEDDSLSDEEENLVDPTVIEQAERYAKARRLLEAPEDESSLWSQLRDASRQLEKEHPNHPVTSDIEEMLSQSQLPSVTEVEKLLDEAESPFKIDERLSELADELQSEYLEHELTTEIVNAVEGDPANDERLAKLIRKAEKLLEKTRWATAADKRIVGYS